jgi:hypothetical protein
LRFGFFFGAASAVPTSKQSAQKKARNVLYRLIVNNYSMIPYSSSSLRSSRLSLKLPTMWPLPRSTAPTLAG